jgi:hypothetical protein
MTDMTASNLRHVYKPRPPRRSRTYMHLIRDMRCCHPGSGPVDMDALAEEFPQPWARQPVTKRRTRHLFQTISKALMAIKPLGLAVAAVVVHFWAVHAPKARVTAPIRYMVATVLPQTTLVLVLLGVGLLVRVGALFLAGRLLREALLHGTLQHK